jgi:hypothetical protein
METEPTYPAKTPTGAKKEESINLIPPWVEIQQQLLNRYAVLDKAIGQLASQSSVDPQTTLQLAATDMFVEKAQARLDEKAEMYHYWAKRCGAMTALSLAFAIMLIWKNDPAAMLRNLPSPITGISVTIVALRSLSLAGFMGAVAFFFGALCKSFLHEAAVLQHRRHAISFGRLYVYLMKGNVDPRWLRILFRWNEEFGSSFVKIKAEELKGGVLSALASIVKSLGETAKAMNPHGATTPLEKKES